MNELEIVWNGSYKDVYLCIPDPDLGRQRTCIPDRLDPTVPKADHSQYRAAVLAVMQAGDPWRLKDLCAATGAEKSIVGGFIGHWLNNGTIRRVGYGTYRRLV